MVAWAFSDVIQPALTALVTWFNLLMNKLSAVHVIVAGAAIVLTVSFLIMPLRGAGLGNVFSAGSDFVIQSKTSSDKTIAKSKKSSSGNKGD